MNKLMLNKGKAMACLMLMCLFLVQGCKKDLLVQKEPPKSGAEIQKISFEDFKRSVDLNKLGFLKQRIGSGSGSGKIMSIGDELGFGLSVNTDAVQKLITKDGVSYIFAMPLISPRAIEFSNLTIQVKGDKTIAFITTFTPTKAWNEAVKKKQPIAFDGNVEFIPIGLETLNLTEALSSVKANSGERIMSAPKKVMNTMACTTYYLYDYVPYGCSSGNHMPDDPNCVWNDPFASVPSGEYRAGYHVMPKSYQLCEDGTQSPLGSSGGGGGTDGETTVYTPGNYNPCDEPPLDGSTRKKNTPCDDSPSLEEIEQITNSALLIKMLNIGDNRRLQFINDPANAAIVNDHLAYIAAKGKTPEVVDFLNWSIQYLIGTPNSFNQAFIDLLNGVYNENSPIYIPNNFDIEYTQEWYNTEDELGSFITEFTQQGIHDTDPIPEMYYKNGTGIDMSPAKPTGGLTVLNAPRNKDYFWGKLAFERPEMFSPTNRARLSLPKPLAPIIDQQWVKYNPTHKSYMGGRLVHHHDGQDYMAFAIPEKVHQKWTKILHEYRLNGKMPGLSSKLISLVSVMQIFSLITDVRTTNPDAWVNWFAQQNETGKIYADPTNNKYWEIMDQVIYKNSAGVAIKAVVHYNVYADFIWDSDEHRYMGVIKLNEFTEEVDLIHNTSKEVIKKWQ